MLKFFKKNIILMLFCFAFCLMSVGYALYGETVNLNGNITLQKVGRIEITSASIVSGECSNISNYGDPTYNGLHIDFKFNTRSKNFTATYLVTVTNNSNVPYTYTGTLINSNIIISGSTYTPMLSSTLTYADSGALFENGESIDVGESVNLKIKMDFEIEQNPSTMNVSGGVDFSVSQDNTGSLIPSITPLTGNLRGDGTIAPFTLKVINTFKYNRSFSLSSSNENIIIVDSNGSSLNNFTIPANSTNEYTIYLMVKKGSIFLTDKTDTNIILSSRMIDDINVGKIDLDVDKDINATDYEKPEIGNVNIKISESNPVDGEAIISWTRLDSGGSSIINYYIELVNVDSGEVKKYETGSSITSYTATGLSAGNYYARVYGEDEAGNIGSDDCSAGNSYCPSSDEVYLRWVFDVTNEIDRYLSFNGESTANIYTSYEMNLSVQTGWRLPDTVEITMGGVTLVSGTDYTYDASTGRIVINKVTGDIFLKAHSQNGCLVEGTKIKLADGSYKNIEDIDYDDLLMVYDHENGGITYEYPIWIEKVKKADSYEKITFSDGSYLNTWGPHSLFSYDKMDYVNVLIPDDFHVGTKIVKIVNGKIKIVSVVKIETINDEINYYHASSTRYHNVIANDVLTTDGTGVTMYLYNFNDDLTWGNARDEFLAKNDLFTYEYLKPIFPKYLYYGYRMAEGKNPYNQGMLFIDNIAYLLNKNNTKEIFKDKDGNNLWMVTTSDDLVNPFNKKKYLRKEDSYYTLPIPKNKNKFIGWLNTGDNKIYKPFDKVKVLHGTHFVAKYE